MTNFRFQLLVIALLLMPIFILNSQVSFIHSGLDTIGNFYEYTQKVDSLINLSGNQDSKGYKQYQRWKYFWETRVNSDGSYPKANEILKDYQSFNSDKSNNQTHSNQWRLLGPLTNPIIVGNVRQQGMGRVNVLRFHPTNKQILYAGSATGGLWKSTNSGTSWTDADFTQFLSIGISDIAIDPKNPQIIYACTGDVNGTFTTQGNFYSIGLIKSTDGGNSWNLMSKLSNQLSDGRLLSQIIINPSNTKQILVATNAGIYKSTDAGENWSLKTIQLYFRHMIIHPSNPDIVYASTYARNSGNTEIHISEDFGETWRKSLEVPNGLRTVLATTIANVSKVYAFVSRKDTDSFLAFYVSDNEGFSWVKKSDYKSIPNIMGRNLGTGNDSIVGQAFFDQCMAVSTTDENDIFIGGINIWRSTNGGTSFQLRTHWTGDHDLPLVHADQHFMIFEPGTTSLYVCHDGGIDKNFTKVNNQWFYISDNMSITQFYRFANSASDPNIIFAGSQDNGTRQYIKNSTYPNGEWIHRYGGDGMEALIDPNNPQRVWVSNQSGTLYRSLNGGSSFIFSLSAGITNEDGAWVTPFALDPNNSNFVYGGFKNVFRSQTGGNANSWKKISALPNTSTLRNIVIAPSNSNYIYTATLFNLFYTKNGLDDNPIWESIQLPESNVTSIAVHPLDPERIWITIGGFNNSSKVFEYRDKKWINLSGNMPNVPVNSIVYQEDSPDRLYIGTDIGVFTSSYGSGFWSEFGSGMPNVIVYELEIQYSVKKLRAATFGRGIWETDLNMCNLTPPTIVADGPLEFCQGDSLKLIASGGAGFYEWSNGEVGDSIFVYQSGSYSVSIRDDNGCSAFSEQVTVNSLFVPNLQISALDGVELCKGDTARLRAGFGFSTLIWSTGSTERTISVTEPGKYTCVATNSNGCKSTNEVEVMFFDPPEIPEIIAFANKLVSSVEGKSYQWYLNDIPIDSSNSKEIEISQLGNFKVEVFSGANCSSMSESFEVLTNIEDNLSDEIIFTILPNPNKGVFEIEFDNEDDHSYSLRIFDFNLRQIREYKNIKTSKVRVDMHEFPTGTYFIELSTNSNTYFKQLIIE